MTAARRLYAALLTLLVPVLLLRFVWRGRREPLYRHAIGERLGHYPDAPSAGWVWIHAVSLGETRAAQALVGALRRERPGLRLLLTHGTATGREAGAALLHPGDRQRWLPLDTPAAVRRFLDHHRPSVGVLMETEIWPNLIAEAHARGIPLVLANARLSERSARRGARLEALRRPALGALAASLAQTADDAERLRAAGADAVEVAGNLKFDVEPDVALVQRGRAWRAMLQDAAPARPVLLAGSTREGEEALLADAWLRRPKPRPLLVVVPRHPQRFDEVGALLGERGLAVARRSAFGESPPAEAAAADAWLGDSLGEMPLYFGLAQVALLGGSFAPLGGQNLIEAAACGCPVVMGPHTFNFAEAAARAEQEGAALRVADMAAALDAALGLLGDPAALAQAAERGRAFAARHRGAAERMARRIAALARD